MSYDPDPDPNDWGYLFRNLGMLLVYIALLSAAGYLIAWLVAAL